MINLKHYFNEKNEVYSSYNRNISNLFVSTNRANFVELFPHKQKLK